jgi:hypothetical protein
MDTTAGAIPTVSGVVAFTVVCKKQQQINAFWSGGFTNG